MKVKIMEETCVRRDPLEGLGFIIGYELCDCESECKLDLKSEVVEKSHRKPGHCGCDKGTCMFGEKY